MSLVRSEHVTVPFFMNESYINYLNFNHLAQSFK